MSSRIINFHEVYDEIWFDKTIAKLKKTYKMVRMEDIEDYIYSGKKLKNACHITVDDGDITFYQVIYPILRKYNVPATIFVSPKVSSKGENFWFQEVAGFEEDKVKAIVAENCKLKSEKLLPFSVYAILKELKIKTIWEIINTYKEVHNVTIGEDFKNMDTEQLLEIDKEGRITIGAHTLNHPILANEEDAVCKEEIEGSIVGLEEILGHRIKYFAYPNGKPRLDFGDREKEILREKDCRLAFSTKAGNVSSRPDVFSVPRYNFCPGNERFVWLRLFVRVYWQNIKDRIVKTEEHSRFELERVLKDC